MYILCTHFPFVFFSAFFPSLFCDWLCNFSDNQDVEILTIIIASFFLEFFSSQITSTTIYYCDDNNCDYCCINYEKVWNLKVKKHVVIKSHVISIFIKQNSYLGIRPIMELVHKFCEEMIFYIIKKFVRLISYWFSHRCTYDTLIHDWSDKCERTKNKKFFACNFLCFLLCSTACWKIK